MKLKRPGLALALLLLTALAVRLPGLGSLGIEPDELATLFDATRLGGPTAGGPGILGRPVYYLLQHVLLVVGPATPLAMRLPALVLGVVGVWATWYAGRRLFGDPGGLVAAALVAVSPWHQYASQFARYWTLVYLLATFAYLFLLEVTDERQPGGYGKALGVLALGALTHPTFVFPMIGAGVAAHAVPPAEGGWWRFRWPTPTAWVRVWLPLGGLVGGWFIFLKVSGNARSLGNFGGRGLGATAAAMFGMVEWATPVVVVAALAAAAYLLRPTAASRERRWGLMTVAGFVTGGVLLFAGGLKNDVYADYGMAILPLAFLTIGGAVAWISEAAPAAAWWPTVGAVAVLTAAQLPGLSSNLVDGMRFDYRPAFAYIERTGPGHLVVGTSTAIQRFDAPGLTFEEFGNGVPFLEQTLARTGGFWLVMARHRGGWVDDIDGSQQWVDSSCRVVLRSGGRRFDYREYDVDLAWCGAAAP